MTPLLSRTPDNFGINFSSSSSSPLLLPGTLLNSNLGTTGAGIYYATATVSGKRVDWYTFNSSASNVSAELTAKGYTATQCYRVTTDWNTVVLYNIPSATAVHCWGAAGASSTPWAGSGSVRWGGPGGYSTGTLSSSLSMATIIVGQGGIDTNNSSADWGYGFGGGGYVGDRSYSRRGGGFSALFDTQIDYSNYRYAGGTAGSPGSNPFAGGISVATAASKIVSLAGGGGTAGGNYQNASDGNNGGGGGGNSGGSGTGGSGGSQSAGGTPNGQQFLGGAASGNGNHGLTCGGGGYYGGGGDGGSGPYNYPSSGGGSGYVNGTYLINTTNTTATFGQANPPSTGSNYYIGNHGKSTYLLSKPQASTNTSTSLENGFHGMVVLIYP